MTQTNRDQGRTPTGSGNQTSWAPHRNTHPDDEVAHKLTSPLGYHYDDIRDLYKRTCVLLSQAKPVAAAEILRRYKAELDDRGFVQKSLFVTDIGWTNVTFEAKQPNTILGRHFPRLEQRYNDVWDSAADFPSGVNAVRVSEFRDDAAKLGFRLVSPFDTDGERIPFAEQEFVRDTESLERASRLANERLTEINEEFAEIEAERARAATASAIADLASVFPEAATADITIPMQSRRNAGYRIGALYTADGTPVDMTEDALTSAQWRTVGQADVKLASVPWALSIPGIQIGENDTEGTLTLI